MSVGMLTLLAGVCGLFAGVLVDVLAARIVSGEGPVTSRLRFPLVSLLWRFEGSRSRSALVELGTAGLFALLASLHPGPVLPALLYLAGAGVLLALVDVAIYRLPNSVVVPSYPVVALLLLWAAVLDGSWDPLLRAGLGGVALFGCYYLLAVSRPGTMGMGDVKLAGLLGTVLAWFSWPVLVVGGLSAFFLGAAFGLVRMLRPSADPRIPFGPFMLLGALVGVCGGGVLLDLYLGFLSSLFVP